MRITIEDLEALKELNDELEENHIETEKQLNEDLSTRTFLDLGLFVYTILRPEGCSDSSACSKDRGS